MPTECIAELFGFAAVERRVVAASFDGGSMTSDAGGLLLGATDRALGLIERFAGCFVDRRNRELIEHEVRTLVGQRVYGLALGYEDLNDHDWLRHDPVMAVLAGKLAARRKDCAAVAGKSTLNRLELSRPEPTRYHKIGHDAAAIEALLVEVFLEAHAKAPEEIVLDLDATDDPLHGAQEGRFFHGYYGHYCYLPLYVFCGRHLLAAKLRPANIDAAAGAQEEIARIVAQIRARWPAVRIVLRADSGFAREALMAWCEANAVDYLFGLARNARLVGEIAAELAMAAAESTITGAPARRFKDFLWTTRDSWSRRRRVVGKAEHTQDEANPRFVVTSLGPDRAGARALYEGLYCARGEMENRIKECQLDLFADRTSSATMRANQLRLWFASFAYVLLDGLRRIALKTTALADATCGSIRLKLLKIGALVRVSVRRVRIAMASGHPWQRDWAIAYHAMAADA
ncbi:MAG: IS1380 family transposase [Rhizobiaceae bacterium]|nr:IS1380 family transposase [Alphaproteobacteria bacterium]MBX3580227.1 IS1380 family transposase [Rhizobiaceae bacterium]MBX3501739.1 IS1380 family transposase [Alphaproteobacteria bacterium]MBX3503103.1 IS1380 family transposase [Alphaproteobacteria bacterium]MBX3503827.1 IS1380 family transposase [Alphaproteobacteria bacterium]